MAAATTVSIIFLCAVILAGMYQATPAMTQCHPLQPLVMVGCIFAPVLLCKFFSAPAHNSVTLSSDSKLNLELIY